MNNTKKRLVASVLAMAMCFTMFIGSTFAWFTDEAKTSVNRLQAGTLEIELERGVYSTDNYMDDPDSYEALPATSLVSEEILWEPGYLWYDNIIVRNTGSLNAKAKVYLISTGDEIGELAKVIDVYVSNVHAFVGDYGDGRDVRGYINGEYKGTGSPWDVFDALNPPTKVGTLYDVINGLIPLGKELPLAPASDKDTDEHLVAIALKMQENAGNEYQGEQAGSFDIVVKATQNTVEEDSFDNQYDKDAKYPITTAKELENAFNDPTVTSVFVAGGKYTKPVVIPTGKTLVSSDGTFDPEGQYDIPVTVRADSDLVVSGGTYMSGSPYAQVIDAQANGSNITIDNGTFEGGAALWVGGTAKVVINGGTFNTWTLAAIDSGNTNPVIVNGGTFNLGSGGIDAGTGTAIIINGGIFNTDPTNWVGEGHTVTEANGLWTVN